jgi:hypothetical protein
MQRETITVDGREIPYEITDVDTSTLLFYRDNPRINYIVTSHPSHVITQQFIEEQLLKLDSTKDLIRDLEANKGMIDEVYVVGNEVVEGNTRLAAHRRLFKKTGDPRWVSIKARVLPDDVTEEELFYILGTFHIKGKTQWNAYEKAAYIHRAITVLNKSEDEIATQLHHNKSTIRAMLRAYEVMRDKVLPAEVHDENIDNATDELRKYSYFEAFYRQKELVKRAQDTPEFLDEFVELVKEGAFPKSQDVREYPKILGNKKALKVFQNSDPSEAFEEAMRTLYVHKPEKVDRFYKCVREFREMIDDADVQKVAQEIKATPGGKNKKEELWRCYKDFKRFCKDIGLEVR